MPHYGDLFFHEDSHKLELRSKSGEGEAIQNEKTKKIIDLKGNYTFLPCATLSIFSSFVNIFFLGPVLQDRKHAS